MGERQATAYALLDPKAHRRNHNGNPHTVAYGRTNPNIDIAASWDFPKGAWVYIPTEFHGKPIGWRQVNDRFGSYEKTKHMRNRIDISMWKLSEAVGKSGWGTPEEGFTRPLREDDSEYSMTQERGKAIQFQISSIQDVIKSRKELLKILELLNGYYTVKNIIDECRIRSAETGSLLAVCAITNPENEDYPTLSICDIADFLSRRALFEQGCFKVAEFMNGNLVPQREVIVESAHDEGKGKALIPFPNLQ